MFLHQRRAPTTPIVPITRFPVVVSKPEPKPVIRSWLFINSPPSMHRVIEVTAAHFGLTVVDILRHDRTCKPTRARHIAMYICRKYLGQSNSAIGRVFARDHTTVLAAVCKTERLLPIDEELAASVTFLASGICMK